MGEYILYVILLFVPIGGVMAYILYKDGLSRKYINIIMFVSLLIILSFPISMERLGGWVSLMIYVLLIAVMSWYILKGQVGAWAVPIFKLPTGGHFINNLLNNNKPAAVIPAGSEIPGDDISCIIETTGDIFANEEILEEKTSLGITPEGEKAELHTLEANTGAKELEAESLIDLPAAVSNVDEDTLMVEPEAGICEELIKPEEKAVDVQVIREVEAEPEPDLIPEAVEIEPESDLTPEAVEGVVSELAAIPQEDKTTPAMDLVSEVFLEEKLAEEDIPEKLTVSEGTAMPIDIDVEVPLIQENESAFVDEINKMQERDELSERQREKQDMAVPDSQERQTDSPVRILELIDNGFTCRDYNREEAARYFEEAWQITSEYELKYMLTVELVEIYKECGWYTKARSILNSFIALSGHKSDIINEINRQIDYISLLAAELERLGISDLPISRVPRWVRLKLDGEMNPPGV